GGAVMVGHVVVNDVAAQLFPSAQRGVRSSSTTTSSTATGPPSTTILSGSSRSSDPEVADGTPVVLTSRTGEPAAPARAAPARASGQSWPVATRTSGDAGRSAATCAAVP